ncbi:hypothetical protein HDU93_002241 [Gonapodya sp. JEL0774]|nr:hypothetical protein HDU93_002241 [Gonapodya sp. JEL0774]
MFIIGLTGGIATGKSTVSKMLSSLSPEDGGPVSVIDLDLIARDVVRPGMPGLRDIVKTFGTEILTDKGEMDRPKMGKIVFGDPEARKKINNPASVQLARLTARDSSTPEAALQRMNAQMPIEEKKGLADVVIDNSNSADDTLRQVKDLVRNHKPGFMSTLAWWCVGAGPASVVWGVLTLLRWAGL